MNGATCPTCGWALRWLPEQGAWGCDRCRKVVPASQVAPPPGGPAPSPYAPPGAGGPAPAPYSPYPMPPAPGYPMPPPAGRRSSNGLVLGLGVGVVAVAGTIAAVLLATGGGSSGGGGSRDDLVKRALAAMGEGDVEQLVKLSDPVGLYNLALDCSERDQAKDQAKQDKDPGKAEAEPKDKGAGGEAEDPSAEADDDDPQIQEKRIRRQHEKLVKQTKGMKIELVSVAGGEGNGDGKQGSDSERKGLHMKKGDKAMKGCVLKVDLDHHALVAKVRVTEPDGKEASEQEVRLEAIEAGGSWYLMAPPKLGASDATAAAEMKEALAKMEGFKAQMCACADRACAERVQKDMQAWAASMASSKSRDAKPRDEDAKKASEIMTAFGACAVKAMAADAATPPDDRPPPPSDPLPPEDPAPSGGADLASLPACAEYRRQIDKVRACPKYPPSAADALKQGYAQIEKSWEAMRSSPGARDQMSNTCAVSAEALKKALEMMCP